MNFFYFIDQLLLALATSFEILLRVCNILLSRYDISNYLLSLYYCYYFIIFVYVNNIAPTLVPSYLKNIITNDLHTIKENRKTPLDKHIGIKVYKT